jgi:hypothetical protein
MRDDVVTIRKRKAKVNTVELPTLGSVGRTERTRDRAAAFPCPLK